MNGRPELRHHMNLMALQSMPEKSSAPRGSFPEQMQALRDAGFQGVQFASPLPKYQVTACREAGLCISASGRVNTPAEAEIVAESLSGEGCECATLHVGWGLEDDREAEQLIESVIKSAGRFRIPLYIETHRATICQDMWRTVQFVERYPEMRFNGDFSHWYAGQEMVYGGFAKKLAFIQPVLDRIGFIHGRIASPGCIQVPAENGAPYVEHFRELWTASFRGFLKSAQAGDHICFTPELLAPDIYYARTFGGVEETDRWEQSLILMRMAEQCFSGAQRS